MIANADHHSYRETGLFSKLILDYIEDRPELRPLHLGLPARERIQEAIERRKPFPTNRTKLVEALRHQYSQVPPLTRSTQQINALLQENTYTITTAHQCNLFLGPTYTIFKILQVIKMADAWNAAYPESHFVPVFYMGSEDADFAELNHAHVLNERLEWNTDQRGAFGRMRVDEALIALIQRVESLLADFPQGAQWVEGLRDAYQPGTTLAESTFRLLHNLFAARGLLILQPDVAALKSSMHELFWEELTKGTSMELVRQSDLKLAESGYESQAHARPINLFYLTDNSRERIEKTGTCWQVDHTSIRWDETALKSELTAHPERFSPNVILRGLYQETILPNLVYVGGGGELAYWLQLKPVFDHHRIPYPLLQLRSSFQWVDAREADAMKALGLGPVELFKPTELLLDESLDADLRKQLDLAAPATSIAELYEKLRLQARGIDPTLDQHVQALATQALNRIQELQKKMKRAARRKLSDRRIQIDRLKGSLFPGGGLQERLENAGEYYAALGPNYFDRIYAAISVWENQFTWLRAESDQSN